MCAIPDTSIELKVESCCVGEPTPFTWRWMHVLFLEEQVSLKLLAGHHRDHTGHEHD